MSFTISMVTAITVLTLWFTSKLGTKQCFNTVPLKTNITIGNVLLTLDTENTLQNL